MNSWINKFELLCNMPGTVLDIEDTVINHSESFTFWFDIEGAWETIKQGWSSHMVLEVNRHSTEN